MAETEKSRHYASTHDYSLQGIGLSKERVEKEFGEIYKRFGIENWDKKISP